MTSAHVWDAADKISTRLHLAAKIHLLRSQLRACGRTCGDCRKWMTQACPAERNRNGRNYGPSASYPACDGFSIAVLAQARSAAWQVQLADLEKQTSKRSE
jgi:hypothetical protein